MVFNRTGLESLVGRDSHLDKIFSLQRSDMSIADAMANSRAPEERNVYSIVGWVERLKALRYQEH